MGTLVGLEGTCVKGEGEDDGATIGVSDPVVYQLVRVQGDGRIVPATDDELVEVEQLLEDDTQDKSYEDVKNQTSVEAARKNEGFLSRSAQSEETEDSRKLNARLEYIEVMLHKVKQEERLRLLGECHNSSPKHVDVSSKTYINFNNSKTSRDTMSILKEADPGSVRLNGNESAKAGESKNQAVYSRSSGSETFTSSIPDFSIISGEICLDNLSIMELQEAFRATFGRKTSVKDKLWLKRRIAMALTNSYNIPTTSFTIKDNKIILEEVKEEASCTPKRSKMDVLSLSIGTNQVVGQHISGKGLGNSPYCDLKTENIQVEQHSAKRLRKPTKRYIEELSESEIRECSARVYSSVKSSGTGCSLNSRIGIVYDGESHGRSFLTRHESVGGFGIQVPYVFRTRRGRPRKNFIALMSFVAKDKILPSTDINDCQGKVELEYERSDAAPESAEDSGNLCALNAGGVRRKHHRAWTLSEVLKLVEGVARCGAGRWSEIRRLAFASYSYRTSVDLKDKWRNLLRASLAQVQNENGGKNVRKQASTPIPAPILCRVRELAELHAQAVFEVKSSKLASHGVGTVQDKGSGFL